MTLRVRYRSAGEVEVLDGRGAVVARLPAAPQGNQALISLAALREISFSASTADGALLEEIGFSEETP